MSRIRDYSAFAIWFAGLGYMALWPISSLDAEGRPFGAALFCPDRASGTLNLLCSSAHPLQLPPGLHALGCVSALFVAVRLLSRALRRSRRPANSLAIDLSTQLARLPQTAPPPRRRKPAPRPRPVKPRAQFGLRGAPH